MIEAEEREPWRDNYQNALAALRMIRETVETLGPPGSLPSGEAVVMLYGPEPIHEGQAISDALRKLLGGSEPVLVQVDSVEQS
jgi:hypothetical protein